MAEKKKSSDDVVNEEADYATRFEKLEERAEKSEGLLEKIATKILGTEPEPKPKPKPDGKPEIKSSAKTGIKAVLPFLFASEE